MKTLFFSLLLFVSFGAMAQKRDYNTKVKYFQDSINKNFPKNTIYVELLGSAFLYSINYDRIFYQHKKFKFSYRLGLSVVPLSRYSDVVAGVLQPNKKIANYIFPLGLNVIYGHKNQFIETGISYAIRYGAYRTIQGFPLTLTHEQGIKGTLSLHLSYRRQSKNGLFFKATSLVIRDEIRIVNSQSSYIKIYSGINDPPSWLWWDSISIGKSF